MSQPVPIIQYTWDISVTADVAKGQRADAAARGIHGVASPNLCKERSCINVPAGGFLTIPPINLGQYPALTFSLWFKPAAASGSYARLVDFHNSLDGDGIAMGRNALSNSMVFAVVRDGIPVELQADLVWPATAVWVHVVWTLSPAVDSGCEWRVYVDGVLQASSKSGLFPADAVMDVNYIGRSNSESHGQFVGFLDSFVIFPVAMKTEGVAVLYKVRV